MKIRYLETTGKCNCKCPYCVERCRNFSMSEEDFYKIVDTNIELIKGQWLWLDFNGEPFMDNHIFERIKYLENKGVKTQLATNGLFLSEDNCSKLVEAGLSYLVVSVVSLDKEIFKKLRGTDCLDEVLLGVERIKATVERTKSKLEIQAVVTDVPGNDIELFKNYFHSAGIHVAVHKFTTRAGRSRLQLDKKQHNNEQRSNCVGLEDNLIVLSDCSVVFCCCDYMGEGSIGNLRNYNYSIIELMKNGKFEQIIKNQKSGIYSGICARCDDWIYHQEKVISHYVEEFPVVYEEK